MQYVSTHISLPQEDYLRLKAEAERQHITLETLIRDKIVVQKKKRSKAEIEKFMQETREIAKKNAKYTKNFDVTKALREIRYQIGAPKEGHAKTDVATFMKDVAILGKKLGKKLKGFDSVQALREIRY